MHRHDFALSAAQRRIFCHCYSHVSDPLSRIIEALNILGGTNGI